MTAKSQGMVWDDFAVFLAAQRGGSQAEAARLMGVDPTTIGRRLTALESRLGARLFDRTPDGLSLSAAGASLLPHAERAEQELLEAARRLGGADARLAGRVRLTAGDGLVSYVLLPALGELRRQHPELELEIRADTRSLDLSRREADLAVRLSRPKQPALIARRLGSMPFALYASRAYLERRGAPSNVAALGQHDFVVFDIGVAQPQTKWLERQVPSLRSPVTVNTTTAQVSACASGLGIALLPAYVARSPLAEAAGLVPVLPRVPGPVREVWAVSHRDLRGNARVTRVVEWLLSRFRADGALS